MSRPVPPSGVADAPATHRIEPAPLVLLLLASTLTVMAGAVISPVLEIIRGDLGVSGTRAGLIITVHGLTIALVSPVVGWVIDRRGVRGPLSGGLVLYGIAGGAGVFTDTYGALIASRVVFGVAAAAVFAGTTVALLGQYRGALRDKVMGWRSTAISLGGVVWPLLAGAVGGISWHAPFAIHLIGIPLGLATLLVLPRGNPTPGEADSGKKARLLPFLRRSPALRGLYLLMIVSSALLYSLAVFVPIRLGEVGVTAPLLVAVIGMSISIAMSIVGMFYARARAGLGYAGMLRLTATLWVVAFMILATTGTAVLMALAMALFGLGTGLLIPAVTVLIGDSAPQELRGSAVALSGTASFAGQFASPLLLGPVVDNTSVTTGYAVAAGVSALLLVAVFRWQVPDAMPYPPKRWGGGNGSSAESVEETRPPTTTTNH
ncbi:MFS transporter [Streptomyces calidiresistens]|uniref:MFS transporter n=1 Tax=Streptomyces calidiresistens TaxID=1485586 RepID=A0A7W3T383_9ACTN|nr:MFS transporter [Streptomyces calidiresistens]MBB0230117.1 MFS transporter [Streptomyces calidiresistens]